jgi:hypothetical protein
VKQAREDPLDHRKGRNDDERVPHPRCFFIRRIPVSMDRPSRPLLAPKAQSKSPSQLFVEKDYDDSLEKLVGFRMLCSADTDHRESAASRVVDDPDIGKMTSNRTPEGSNSGIVMSALAST